ncbi:hypothetical protein PLICRDRAFT_147639 [Plicaturopsis crispa FD-325 SS-3]|uniref:FAS1 domain-containing protein n=1 Tax=Plicaturopsis crispa FD-325 SS-3 TaxID=944288 RepID=A0A0C9T724_PLICR|nr:hypothetical protein PLICRDRAFT_147639 [Plicaturopsis crispa FD-325 SS-3]
MRTAVLASLALGFVPTVYSAVNDTYVAALSKALSSAGLTQLAAVAAKVNSTTLGQELLAALPTGQFAVFAPNDDAFKGVPANVSSNVTALAEILSYHILPGNFAAAAAMSPSVTIGRTMLNDSSLVMLEGGKSQVLVWTSTNGTTSVLGQSNITVGESMPYENLTLHVITGVLVPPAPLVDVLTSNNLTAALGVVGSVSGLPQTLASTHGYTLFAPTDAAVMASQDTLKSIMSNQTLLLSVLQNHVINGTSAYSPILMQGHNYTTAAGEPLTTTFNSSGAYVMSGTAMAKIVRTDILASNGVVHVIDAVLADLESNAGAASSAYMSASSAATVASTQTGPLGASAIATAASSGKKNSAGMAVHFQPAALVLALAVGFGAVVLV